MYNKKTEKEMERFNMTNAVTEKKSFGIAVLIWFLFGAVGGHRVYVTEKASILLWYWIPSLFSCGLFPLIGLFRIKKSIREQHQEMFLDELKINQAVMMAQQRRDNETYTTPTEENKEQ